MQQINNLFPFPEPAAVDERTKREKYIEQHFPEVAYATKPCGNHVLAQLRLVPKFSPAGIEYPRQTRDFNEQQTCLAIVRDIGPAAFKDRDSGKAWHEGAWYKVGQLVMVKRYAGERFGVPIPKTEDRVIIVDTDEYNITRVVDDEFDDLENLYDQII